MPGFATAREFMSFARPADQLDGFLTGDLVVTSARGDDWRTANGYGLNLFEEAWWCCVHDGGLAMTEYARHAVTFRDGAIRVNLWVPGKFALPLPGGRTDGGWEKILHSDRRSL